ncbi:MAG: DNA-binding GntR family transcriptional regulator [Paracoccaceae bacterium]|jgi:DNA-binding GntR family transcriptional regulator
MMNPIRSVSAADIYDELDPNEIDRMMPIAPQVYAILRQRIVDNRLQPGAPIGENTLALRLNISRTPLRAALQQLAKEGMIVTRPQVGSVVAQLDGARLEEAVVMRAALEAAVVRRLAERGFREQLLTQSFAEQEIAAEADDYATFFSHDETFHAKLAELAGLPNVWAAIQSVKGHVDRQRYKMMAGIPFRSRRAFRDHKEIVRLILAGDADGAEQAMRAHVNSVLEMNPNAARENDEIQKGEKT